MSESFDGEAETVAGDGSGRSSGRDASHSGEPTANKPVAEKPGDVIGPYKLLQQIGEGGFGVVYMAEQSKPVKRRVALKIIKPGMDTKDVIARFEAERQALALMDHPGIANVLDAGATDTGRPYFVMELVKGVTVVEYCDTHRLDTRQRLELFRDICGAVQHAHQKGVIHRDLKPSNILVTHHDTRPGVKVIDFGVAKSISQELTEKTLFTVYGQMVGTPVYMSPEQAEMSGLDVDTRSDLYSLGVVLYELLTGRTPLDPQRLREAGFDEMHRLIREEEAPKPSTKLSSLADEEITTIAKAHHEAPEKLTRLVRGDLDWIVMKALEKDRNRRYETATGFAEDIRRYLEDEPVLASPPSTRYRLLKFARRNRTVLTTVGLLLATLFAATSISLWQAAQATTAKAAAEQETVRAKRAELLAEERLDQIDEQRREAEKGRAEAEAVAGLIEEMLGSAAPTSGGGSDLTVREMLDVYSEKLDTQLDAQPEVELRIRITLGTAFYGLDEWERAEPQLQKAYELSRSINGTENLFTAEAARMWGKVLIELERFDEAEKLLREANESIDGNGAVTDEDRAEFLGSLADVLSSTDPNEAESFYHRALEAAGYADSHASIQIALLLDGLSGLYSRGWGEIDNPRTIAKALREEAIEMIEATGGEEAAELVPILYDQLMGGSHLPDSEREELRRRVSQLAKKHYGDHPRTAQWLFQIGWNYRLTGGDLDRADGYFAEAKEIVLRAIEKRRGNPGEAYFWLGFYATDSGDRETGCESLRKAVEYYENTKFPRKNSYRAALTKLADLTTNGPEAIKLYEKALGITRDTFGLRSRSYGYDLAGFGKVLMRFGDRERAEIVLRESAAIWNKVNGWSGHHFPWQSLAGLLQGQNGHQEALRIWTKLARYYDGHEGVETKAEEAYRNIAYCQLKLGDDAAAEEASRRAIAIAEQKFGRSNPNTANAIKSLVAVHLKRGETSVAEELIEGILTNLAGSGRSALGQKVGTILQLADLKKQNHKFREAEQLYQEAITESEKLGDRGKEIVDYMLRIAGTKRATRDFGGAVTQLLEAIQYCQDHLGESDPKLISLFYELGRAHEESGDSEKAEQAYSERLALLREIQPDASKPIADALSKLASLCKSRGDVVNAERFIKEGIVTWAKKAGKDSPEALAGTLSLAGFYRGLGRHEESLPHYEKVWKKRRELFGDGDATALQAMRMTGAVLRSLGNLEEAIERLKVTTRLCDRFLGEEHPDSVATLWELGHANRLAKKYPDAIEILTERLKRLREQEDMERAMASTLNEIFYAKWNSGDKEGSFKMLFEKLDLQRKALGERHFDVGNSLAHLAGFLAQAKRHEESVQTMREALSIIEESEQEIWRELEVKSRLGEGLQVLGKMEEAQTLVLESYLEFEKYRGKIPESESRKIREARDRVIALGAALGAEYGIKRQIEWLKRVIAKMQEPVSADNADHFLFRNRLADAEKSAGNFSAAVAAKREAVELSKAILGGSEPDTLRESAILGDWLRQDGSVEEAIQLLLTTMEDQRRTLGDRHGDLLTTGNYLASAYSVAKNHEKALAIRLDSVRLYAEIHGIDHLATLGAKQRLASSLRSTGDSEGCIKVLGEIVDDGERKHGGTHPVIISTRQELGTRLVEAKRYDEGEPVVRACLKGRKATDPDHWRIFSDTSLLGEALLGQKRFDEAEPLLLEGYQGLKANEAKLGALNLWQVSSAVKRLVRLYTDWGKPDDAQIWKDVQP